MCDQVTGVFDRQLMQKCEQFGLTFYFTLPPPMGFSIPHCLDGPGRGGGLVGGEGSKREKKNKNRK
mgnify:CR=1 FL=1